MKTKNNFKPIAVTAALAILTLCPTACSDDSAPADDGDTITLGNIAVGTVSESKSRAAAGDITEPFWEGDELTVYAYPETSAVADYIARFSMNASGNWDITEPMYVEDVKTGYRFSAIKSAGLFPDDQSTLENYHAADHIYGNLILNGKTLSTRKDDPLQHRFVDVVLTLTPAADWNSNGNDFKAHLDEAEVNFFDAQGKLYFPYRVAGTDKYTFRAILSNSAFPAPGNILFTITPKDETPITGTYTLATGTPPVSEGQRLTVTVAYDNKRSLSPIKVEVKDWEDWDEVELEP